MTISTLRFTDWQTLMNKSIRQPKRWQLTLGVILFSQFMTAVGFSMIVPFLPLYVRELGSVSGLNLELAAGLVVSATGFTMMFAAPIWGVLADRYGRKLMLLRATYGGTLILGSMGLAQNVEQLILLRALQGGITGTVAASNALVAAIVPRERSGFAMSLLQMGFWGGITLGPLLGGLLADAFGYHAPYIATAALLGMSGLFVQFGVDEQHAPMPTTPQARQGFIASWKHVIHHEGVPALYTIRFLAGVARNMLLPIAPLFVVALLPASTQGESIYAGMVSAVASFSATISGVYLGRLGDRIGHRTILVGAALLGGLGYIPQMFVQDVWQLIALQATSGVAIGGVIAALSASLAQYTQPGEEGAVYGLDQAILSAAFALAPMIGALAAMTIGARGSFGFAALLFFCVSWVAYTRLKPLPQVATMAAAGD